MAECVEHSFGSLGLEGSFTAAVFAIIERCHRFAYVVSDCFHIAKIRKIIEFSYICHYTYNLVKSQAFETAVQIARL